MNTVSLALTSWATYSCTQTLCRATVSKSAKPTSSLLSFDPKAEIEPLLPKTARMAALDGLSKIWGISIESLIYRMGELRLISDISVRRAHQRLASMAEYRREEPLTAYPGEFPTLLQEAIALAARHGYDRDNLPENYVGRRVT